MRKTNAKDVLEYCYGEELQYANMCNELTKINPECGIRNSNVRSHPRVLLIGDPQSGHKKTIEELINCTIPSSEEVKSHALLTVYETSERIFTKEVSTREFLNLNHLTQNVNEKERIIRYQYVPCVKKIIEDLQFIDLALQEQDPMYLSIISELVLESECMLFLWETFAEEPSKEFLSFLKQAIEHSPTKCGIIITNVDVNSKEEYLATKDQILKSIPGELRDTFSKHVEVLIPAYDHLKDQKDSRTSISTFVKNCASKYFEKGMLILAADLMKFEKAISATKSKLQEAAASLMGTFLLNSLLVAFTLSIGIIAAFLLIVSFYCFWYSYFIPGLIALLSLGALAYIFAKEDVLSHLIDNLKDHMEKYYSLLITVIPLHHLGRVVQGVVWLVMSLLSVVFVLEGILMYLFWIVCTISFGFSMRYLQKKSDRDHKENLKTLSTLETQLSKLKLRI